VGLQSRSGVLASAGIRTSDSPARSLVTIRTKRDAGETGTPCVVRFNLNSFVQLKYKTK
jgi:hypothetical protein